MNSIPVRMIPLYLIEKHMHETELTNYITDMLWAPANGMKYKNIKRYSEIHAGKENNPELNGEDILNELINAW